MVRVSSSKHRKPKEIPTLSASFSPSLFWNLIREPQGELSGTDIGMYTHMYSHIYLDRFYCPRTYAREGESYGERGTENRVSVCVWVDGVLLLFIRLI